MATGVLNTRRLYDWYETPGVTVLGAFARAVSAVALPLTDDKLHARVGVVSSVKEEMTKKPTMLLCFAPTIFRTLVSGPSLSMAPDIHSQRSPSELDYSRRRWQIEGCMKSLLFPSLSVT